MSTFDVRIHRITIEPHPNADRLELAVIGGYRCIIGKDQYRTGMLAAYIPEAAICPEDIIAELGLEGRLSGKQKNRVKAVRLRGILSQGLVYPLTGKKLKKISVSEGDDVMGLLGITKYEPPIPINLAGEAWGAYGATLKYDIENLKRYPDAFLNGEQVVVTEKLHGTWCCLGLHPDHETPIVTSKGLSAQGLAL
ncbi:MAG: RNA ligase (ATP), partial [Candidatus Dadabacteria bacterium]|nr:RNA ligase (ATP) [Candidatus Dadabacteria bacterium]